MKSGFILGDRRWDKVHSFEFKHKKIFLKKLTTKKSMTIFADLYRFAQGLNKGRCKQIELINLKALIKTHSIFMKLKI